MEIKIEENTSNLKNRTKFFNDFYLKMLVEICIDCHDVHGVLMFIRYMFYSFSLDEYDEQLSLVNIYYNESMEILTQIHLIFSEWKPFDKYNMGELRGAFLELFVYELLRSVYGLEHVYQESRIIIGDFKSYTLDFIVQLEDVFNMYECKFSVESFKRNHLNQLISIVNKYENCNLFVIFFQPYKKVYTIFDIIQESTSNEKFQKMLDKLTIITLDDFVKNNPFLNLEYI
ncbi:MAG: hypothetical protein IJI98_10235 [Methanosphaera sp.]|nr:hypothetical protein [Methanosphaera sp.]